MRRAVQDDHGLRVDPLNLKTKHNRAKHQKQNTTEQTTFQKPLKPKKDLIAPFSIPTPSSPPTHPPRNPILLDPHPIIPSLPHPPKVSTKPLNFQILNFKLLFQNLSLAHLLQLAITLSFLKRVQNYKIGSTCSNSQI